MRLLVGGEHERRPDHPCQRGSAQMEAGLRHEISLAEESTLLREVQSGWLEFLSRVEWDWFLTVTFKKPRKDPYYALNAVESALRSVYRHPTSFIGAELHRSGDVHVHGLFRVCRSCNNDPKDTFHLWAQLFGRLGRSEVVPPRSAADVNKYVTKYCTKDLTDYRILGIIGTNSNVREGGGA